MEDLLSPIERNVHSYLTNSIAKDLVEVLAKLSLVRPADPYLFLAQELLRKSPSAGDFHIAPIGAAKGHAPSVRGDIGSRGGVSAATGGLGSRQGSRQGSRPGSRSTSPRNVPGGAERGGDSDAFAGAGGAGRGGAGAERPFSGVSGTGGGAFTDITSRPSTRGY